MNQPIKDLQSRSITTEVATRNRVQWGPIVAGVLSALGTLLILAVLGVAIGASALEPRDSGESIGTAAAIYGAISAIVAFFIGGFVAAKTAAVTGGGAGGINGLMVGFTIFAIVLYLTGAGIGNIVGTLGSNISDLTSIAQDQGVTTQDAEQAADAAQEQAEQVDPNAAFQAVEDSAWWTLLGLVIPLAAAAAGGVVGNNSRRDLIENT